MSRLRLALIGNSHLGALKLGWSEALATAWSVEPTFFGALGGNLKDVEVHGAVLRPTSDFVAKSFAMTAAGLTAIDADAYDAFICVGAGARMQEAMDIYRSHRLAEHAEPESDLVSPACLDETIHCRLNNSVGLRTVAKLRQITDRPIVVMPDPLPSENILREVSVNYKGRQDDNRALWAGAYTPFLRSRFEGIFAAVARELEATPWLQPAETIAPPAFTRAHYTAGAPFFLDGDKPRGQADHFHMNGAYGALMLASVMPVLAELTRA